MVRLPFCPVVPNLREQLRTSTRVASQRRIWAGVLAGCLCGTCLGCNVYRELRRTLSTAAQEEKRFEQTQRRNLDWSQALWQQFVEAQPGLEWTPDFQTGFRDGADFYLVHGVIVTPTHPPLPYWSVAAQSPAGRAAIDEWHRGFEAGALAADQQGLREEVTLPVRVPDPDSIGRPQIMSYPGFAAAPAVAPLSPEPQDPQLLPAEPLPAASERAADPK